MTAALRLAPPPALSALSWWRVEFAAGGSITSVRQVEQQERSEGLVVYVRAKTEELARLRANAERQRVALRWRRAAYRAAGLCRCGRVPRPGMKTCEECRIRRAADSEALQRRLAGEVITRPSKALAYRQRLAELQRTARMDLLLEVKSAWARMRNDHEFTAWLRVTIERIGGGP